MFFTHLEARGLHESRNDGTLEVDVDHSVVVGGARDDELVGVVDARDRLVEPRADYLGEDRLQVVLLLRRHDGLRPHRVLHRYILSEVTFTLMVGLLSYLFVSAHNVCT